MNASEFAQNIAVGMNVLGAILTGEICEREEELTKSLKGFIDACDGVDIRFTDIPDKGDAAAHASGILRADADWGSTEIRALAAAALKSMGVDEPVGGWASFRGDDKQSSD
jgi:hypothetical protein